VALQILGNFPQLLPIHNPKEQFRKPPLVSGVQIPKIVVLVQKVAKTQATCSSPPFETSAGSITH
jgi:hypothetical protein